MIQRVVQDDYGTTFRRGDRILKGNYFVLATDVHDKNYSQDQGLYTIDARCAYIHVESVVHFDFGMAFHSGGPASEKATIYKIEAGVHEAAMKALEGFEQGA